MEYIIRLLIIFCTKRAYKYEELYQTLLKANPNLGYAYTIGTMVLNRERWLKRIIKLQKCIVKLNKSK